MIRPLRRINAGEYEARDGAHQPPHGGAVNALAWSSSRPSAPGWYVCREKRDVSTWNHPHDGMGSIWLMRTEDIAAMLDKHALAVNTRSSGTFFLPADQARYEWFGPLPMPVEPVAESAAGEGG